MFDRTVPPVDFSAEANSLLSVGVGELAPKSMKNPSCTGTRISLYQFPETEYTSIGDADVTEKLKRNFMVSNV